RWAARSYGAASFERGLRHAIAAELRFDGHANATLKQVIEHKQSLRNLYTFTPSERPDADVDHAALIEEIVNAEPSPYDSHPRPADRFRWVTALAPPVS
ncbi:MAG: hypothetical protein KC431_27160, partial [Myxococcales bacterium]|nr:hypothetical protein [Myxococcales bacterium]